MRVGMYAPAEHIDPERLRTLDFLVDDGRGELLRLAKLGLTQRDNSLYVVPISPTSTYRITAFGLGAGEVEGTFRFDEQHDALDKAPKLSLHASGVVHAGLDRDARTLQRQIPPLRYLRGEHVATVMAGSFDALAPWTRRVRRDGPERQIVIGAAGAPSCRLAIYVNGQQAQFACPCRWALTVQRGDEATPIHVGFAPLWQDTLAEGADAVVALAGWDPTCRDVAKPMGAVAVVGTMPASRADPSETTPGHRMATAHDGTRGSAGASRRRRRAGRRTSPPRR